ncbi:kinase-like domain-containing protein, partial [Jimgerdemannia flammicorona]
CNHHPVPYCLLLPFSILAQFISHPNIVRLLNDMETEHYLCLLLEYVPGGELFDLVERMHENDDKEGEGDDTDKGMDEATVRRLFLQLVDAVEWLHERNVVHRDLKLENVLVTDRTNPSTTNLKLTDFGLARVIDPANPTLTTRCGSEEYAAPEIIKNQGYDGRRTDVWALGIILYAMLVGELPFTYAPERGEKVSHLFYKVMKAEVKWPRAKDTPRKEGKERVRGVSDEAKEVVERILVRDPEKRIKLNELRGLRWFRETEPKQVVGVVGGADNLEAA